MEQATSFAPTPPLTELGAEWFDPLEEAGAMPRMQRQV
jgi:hypothetical protein